MANFEPMDPAEGQLTEDQLRRIFRRAIEIDDARKMEISESELREIAADLGISMAALSVALREVRSESLVPTTASTRLESRWFSWLQPSPILVAVTGLGLGAVTRALRPLLNAHGMHLESLGSLAILALITLLLALRSRAQDGQRDFQMSNAALWGSFTAGWSIIHGTVWDDLLGVMAVGTSIAAVIGGLVVAIRRRNADPPSADAALLTPALPSLPKGHPDNEVRCSVLPVPLAYQHRS